MGAEVQAALLALADQLKRNTHAEDPAGARMVKVLTRRELEVLGCLADGMQDRAICEHLGITYQTVKRHLVNTRDKTGMDNSRELIVAVYRHPALYAAVTIPSLREEASNVPVSE